MQIRQNAQELNDYLKDLYQWEDKVENKTPRQVDENQFPIRNFPDKLPPSKAEVEKFRKNKTNIKDYFQAWENMDVENYLEQQEFSHEDSRHNFELNSLLQILSPLKIQKDKGNQLFLQKKYQASLEIYLSIERSIDEVKKEDFKMEKSLFQIRDLKVKVLGNISQIHLLFKDLVQTESYCNKVLALDPLNQKAYYRLSKVYWAHKYFTKSLETLKKGIEVVQDIKEKDFLLEQMKKVRKMQQKHF